MGAAVEATELTQPACNRRRQIAGKPVVPQSGIFATGVGCDQRQQAIAHEIVEPRAADCTAANLRRDPFAQLGKMVGTSNLARAAARFASTPGLATSRSASPRVGSSSPAAPTTRTPRTVRWKRSSQSPASRKSSTH